jgi:beta-lactamase class A
VRAGLPPGVTFASKSGSGAGTAVEAGYLTLPQQRGTVALAIFVKSSPLTMGEREAAIAEIGRVVYDYFVLTSAAPR